MGLGSSSESSPTDAPECSAGRGPAPLFYTSVITHLHAFYYRDWSGGRSSLNKGQEEIAGLPK